MDGSRCVPFDKVKAELYYPSREENQQTTNLVMKMAVEVSECMLMELRDPKKATSSYLSSADGKFSWGETTEEEHLVAMGKMATNDPAESPFAMLTQQMQQYGRILGIHASAIGQARMNGDFVRDLMDSSKTGMYHQLSSNMRESLVQYAVSIPPEVCKEARDALDMQAKSKQQKKEALRKKKLVAAQVQYANALTYIDMYHSPACWRDIGEARKKYGKLRSETAKREACKEQIRIRVLGFGWSDLHHAWSEGGVDFSADKLFNHLTTKCFEAQQTRQIPTKPKVNLPSRGERQQLGTRSLDVDRLDKLCDADKKKIEKEGEQLREMMEEEGKIDRHKKLQGGMPDIDETLINFRIEQLWEFIENDSSAVLQWCKGTIVGVKKDNKVHIKWDKESLRDGDPEITQEKLLVTKWNKHDVRGWRRA